MCLDGTHGTNRHGYHLFTVASKDKFGRVIALAFLVTRFNTQDIICDFLKAAILAHGITPQTIVTDDGTTEGPAATTVFPAPKTRHLLCYVHILRAWSVSDGLCRTVDTTGSPQLTASLALTCLAWTAPPPHTFREKNLVKKCSSRATANKLLECLKVLGATRCQAEFKRGWENMIKEYANAETDALAYLNEHYYPR